MYRRLLFTATVLFCGIVTFTGCRRPTISGTADILLTNTHDLIQSGQTIPADEQVTFWSNYPPESLATRITSLMTDEELLSQIMMFGWVGAEPSKIILEWVEKRQIGSVKVFGWNTDNTDIVAKSIRLLQRKSQNSRFQIPLLIATDQEGGWIRHVKGRTSETPGNLAIGASGIPYDAYSTGFFIAKELRALGINMNFAPTVDLYTDIYSTVIGPRSFGEDAVSAGILGLAFCKGHLDCGVIPTAKHFPGHGDTRDDSHGVLPVIMADYETIINRELIPFRMLADSKIPAIMSGHLNFPAVTGNKDPATLSPVFLKQILREELQFNGLIITDDMMMNGAIATSGSLSEAVTGAIEAGNDIILLSSTPLLYDALWTKNISKMHNNNEFRQTVKTAAKRVLKTKLQYLRGEKAVPLYPEIPASQVPAFGASDFFLEQSCRSLTLLRKGIIPLKTQDTRKILLVGQFSSFMQEGKKRYPKAGTLLIPYALGPNATAYYGKELRNLAPNYDVIIYCLATKEGAQILQKIQKTDVPVIVVSILAPVFLQDVPWADSVLAAYSYAPNSFAAAFSAIAGDFEPTGILPITNSLLKDESK